MYNSLNNKQLWCPNLFYFILFLNFFLWHGIDEFAFMKEIAVWGKANKLEDVKIKNLTLS